MGGKRKTTQKKAAARPAATAAIKAEATVAGKHTALLSVNNPNDSAAAVVSWEDDNWEPIKPLPVQPNSISSDVANNSTDTAQRSPTSWEVDKGSSDRKLVFYGPPVCYHCGDRGHAGTGCSTPFCMSCDVWGHAKGQCADACERCGRVHERRDGVCRTFYCQICGLFGHRPTQCPGCLCDACGFYGHSTNRCPTSRACPLCGELGHPQSSCPLLCSRCGYPGHKTEDCMMKQCERCSLIGHVAAECLFSCSSAAAEAGEASEGVLASATAMPAVGSSNQNQSKASRQPRAGTASTLPPAPLITAAGCSNGMQCSRTEALVAPNGAPAGVAALGAAGVTPAGHPSAAASQVAAAPIAAAPLVQTAGPNLANWAAMARQHGAAAPAGASALGPPPLFLQGPAGFHAHPPPNPQHQDASPHQVLMIPPGMLPHLQAAGLPHQHQEQCRQQDIQEQQTPSVAWPTAPVPRAEMKNQTPEDEEFEEMLGLLGVEESNVER